MLMLSLRTASVRVSPSLTWKCSALQGIVPELLRRPCELIGSMNTPLSMFITGMLIAASDLRQVVKSVRLWCVAALRLLVIPAPHIHIGIDFDHAKTETFGEAGISIRIGTLLGVGLGVGIPALKWFLRFQKKQKQQSAVPEKEAPAAEHTAA